jgi:3-oxoacyl-[acyl-carrier protein] reductase
MAESLAGKVALVTGGASGIGEAVCRAFDREGAAVVVVDIDGERAARNAAELRRAVALTADVSVSVDVDACVESAVSEFGRLDIAANIAGIDDPDAKVQIGERVRAGRMLDITVTLTDAKWRRMMSVNLDGAFYVTRAALRVMIPQGSGAIVNMASMAGVHGDAGFPHYSAAKAGSSD